MARPFKALVAFGYLAAIAGGIFLGLWSCGGYVWHEQFVFWSLATFAVAFLICPPFWRPTFARRLLLAVFLPVLFFLSQALTAPFYLGFTSASEYVAQALRALTYGPC